MVLYRLTEHCGGGGATEWIEHFNASFYSRIRILMRKFKAFKNIKNETSGTWISCA